MTTTGNSSIKFETKSQLAKLLATENIFMQHNPGAITASFDIKSRLLVLPVWKNVSEDLYDMLVVHEVGHAIDTPHQMWLSAMTDIAIKHHGKSGDDALAVIKDYLNVVEDARIEKRQKRRYPGSKRNFVVGYQELYKKNFFGIDGKDVNTLPFIDRANLYFKNGLHLNIKFTDEEKTFIDRMGQTETFEDVIALTEDLYGFCRKQIKEKKKEEKSASGGDKGKKNTPKSQEGKSKPSNNPDKDENQQQKSSSASDKGSDEETETDTEASQEQSQQASSGNGSGENKVKQNYNVVDSNQNYGDSNDEDSVAEKSVTEEAAKEAASTLVQKSNENYVYLNIPDFYTDKIVDDFSKVIPEIENDMTNQLFRYDTRSKNKLISEFNDWRNKEKDNISFMVKEFETKKSADMYSRIRTAKTGVINTNKIFSYKYNDDIFRRHDIVPEGKNHGFVMLLDWSGSMTDNIKNTMKQLLSLVLFCKRVQIPFEVYTFRTATMYDKPAGNQHEINRTDSNYLQFSDFKLRNILSSRMTTTMLNRAFHNLWILSHNSGHSGTDPLNGTPLNQAILAIEPVINEFRKRNKIQILSTIILTDGCSDGFQIQNTRYSSMKNVYFVYDKKTRKIYKPEQQYGNSVTEVFLRVLKDRTDCNLVGFFLHNGGLGGLSYLFKDEQIKNMETQKSWKEQNFCAVSSVGYDEYYIMKSSRDMSKVGKLEVNSSMTSRAIINKFIDFSEKKTNTRPVLRKFIDKVCREL